MNLHGIPFMVCLCEVNESSSRFHVEGLRKGINHGWTLQ